MRLSAVIPTYKRPDTLRETLESILKVTEAPDEVLVIDDDVLSEEFLSEFKDKFAERGIPFYYHQKDHAKLRRGLSETKNWAAEITTGDVVTYIDDDVVLEPNYFAKLKEVWEENWSDEKLAGVGGKAINGRLIGKVERLFYRLFGLAGKYAWDVNDVGFQSWDISLTDTERGYYLEGCSSSYRRGLILSMPFATFAGGRTALEDVEHCLRAKLAGHHFLYAPSVRLTHHQAPIGRDAAFLAGWKEGHNRKIIFQTLCKNDLYHKLWFFWANVGWTLKKMLAFKFLEAGGMIFGLLTAR